MNVTLETIDPADAARLIEWNDVIRRAYCDGRQGTWWRAPETTLSEFRNPPPTRRVLAIAAYADGVMVGGVEADARPGAPSQIEVGVLSGLRRRGIGRTLAVAALHHLGQDEPQLWQSEVYSETGVAFGEALGLRVVNTEIRQLLDLHSHHFAELEGTAAPQGLELRGWTGRCPEDLAAHRAELEAQMDEDAPLGAKTHAVRAAEVERFRRNEAGLLTRGYQPVATLALVNGQPAGYTELLVNRHDPEIALQEDTMVERAFRGRGIGRLLKLANLTRLKAEPTAADTRWVQCYVNPDNGPMLTVNTSLGFVHADTMTALEGRLHA